MEPVNIFQNPIIAAILGAIGGVVLTLATKFGEGWIGEFFEKRKQARTEKLRAAKDINSFVTEGMHKGFRIRAGSEQHIKFRAAEIEGIDIEAGIKLRQFIAAWSMYRNFLKKEPYRFEDEKMAIEYNREAQRLGNELLEIARKWAK